MGALAVDSQLDFWTAPEPELAGRPALAAVVHPAPGGGERTLEDWVLGAWEELAARGEVDCPLCGGAMVAVAVRDTARAVHGVGSAAACRDCGTELS